jgi:hypothetical protein
MRLGLPPTFRRWLTKGYWHFQGFFVGLAGVVVFAMVFVSARQLEVALPFGVLTVICGVIWSMWARRWGKFRNRNPWDEP